MKLPQLGRGHRRAAAETCRGPPVPRVHCVRASCAGHGVTASKSGVTAAAGILAPPPLVLRVNGTIDQTPFLSRGGGGALAAWASTARSRRPGAIRYLFHPRHLAAAIRSSTIRLRQPSSQGGCRGPSVHRGTPRPQPAWPDRPSLPRRIGVTVARHGVTGTTGPPAKAWRHDATGLYTARRGFTRLDGSRCLGEEGVRYGHCSGRWTVPGCTAAGGGLASESSRVRDRSCGAARAAAERWPGDGFSGSQAPPSFGKAPSPGGPELQAAARSQ